MITLRRTGGEYDVEVTAEPPMIYLDHWALHRLSEDATLSGRFLAAFAHRGTVMFSLMNVEEIARVPHQCAHTRFGAFSISSAHIGCR